MLLPFPVPQAARDVTVIPQTPEEIKVTWLPPEKLNGPASKVTYVVHFSTITDQGHFMRQTENLVLNKSADGSIYTVLKGLEPSHVYDVKVRDGEGGQTEREGQTDREGRGWKEGEIDGEGETDEGTGWEMDRGRRDRWRGRD